MQSMHPQPSVARPRSEPGGLRVAGAAAVLLSQLGLYGGRETGEGRSLGGEGTLSGERQTPPQTPSRMLSNMANVTMRRGEVRRQARRGVPLHRLRPPSPCLTRRTRTFGCSGPSTQRC